MELNVGVLLCNAARDGASVPGRPLTPLIRAVSKSEIKGAVTGCPGVEPLSLYQLVARIDTWSPAWFQSLDKIFAGALVVKAVDTHDKLLFAEKPVTHFFTANRVIAFQ